MILDYKISIGQFIFFLFNYILMRFNNHSYGSYFFNSGPGEQFFIPILLIVSFNSAWHLSSYLPFFNNIISLIVYLLFFIIYNIYYIFIWMGDGTDDFPTTEIINIVFISIIVIMEMLLIKLKINLNLFTYFF